MKISQESAGARTNTVDDLLRRSQAMLRQNPNVQFHFSGSNIESQRIASDGSTRIFLRVHTDGCRVILAAPAATTPNELAEANSAWKIGKHLAVKNAAVPELFGFDKDIGLLVFEDLGDVRLHEVVAGLFEKAPGHTVELEELYYKVIDKLIHMQVHGRDDFQQDWCWDTPVYDISVMIDKESGYFLRAFWNGLLGFDTDAGVLEEFAEIARVAGEADASFFLHRDFQSRNVMVDGEDIRFIDFQGGRFGPLGYDLASLLIDPYAGLTLSIQEKLLDYYQQKVSVQVQNNTSFIKNYQFLALQRNLQIIGAFSFLSTQRKKKFFEQFLWPALTTLNHRLEHSIFADYHQLKKMVTTALRMVEKP